MLPRANARDVRPYNIRITRDHGGGLWTMEADDGQLYLAVLSKSVEDFRRERDEQRRASGETYRRLPRSVGSR